MIYLNNVNNVVYCWLEYLRIENESGTEAAELCLIHMKQEYALTDVPQKEWNSAKLEAIQLLKYEGLL